MPTVLRRNGFEIAIRTRDHEPPHVHVLRSGVEVVVNLGIDSNVPYIRENRGMSRIDIRRAIDIVTLNNDILLKEWQRFYP